MPRLLLFLAMLAFTKIASGQTTVVPDSSFRSYLVQNFSSYMGKNQVLVDSLAAKFTGGMDCSGRNIASISGIEKFTGITTLNCSNNQIASLDPIKGLTKLTSLDAYKNMLTHFVDVSRLVNLTYLNFAGNQITSVSDLSNNVALYHFDCFDNQIQRLPGLDKLVNLNETNLYDNSIDSLPDLSKLSKLTILQFYNNNLSSIPGLSNLTNLNTLIGGGNPLNQLPDVSKLTKMQTMLFWGSQLVIAPNISTMTALTYFDVNNNAITSLDVSKNKNLTQLNCQDNLIDTIVGLKNLTALKILDIQGNRIRNINDVTVAQGTLTDLLANHNQLSSLPDFSKFKALKKVNVGNNKLNFNDLLPFLQISTLPDTSFNYAPQQQVTIPSSMISSQNSPFMLSIGMDENISSDVYTWTKNGVSYVQGKTDTLAIKKLVLADSGLYACTIVNPLLPELTLSTNDLKLTINSCIDLSQFKYSTEDINCEKGGKITVNESSISGGKTPYKLKLTSVVLGKTTIAQGNSFSGLSEKKYVLEVTDQSGCVASTAVALQGKGLEDCMNRVIIVNSSGDASSLFLEEQGFAKVFDKSGKQVHSFPTPGAWDGNTANGELPPGLYLVEYNGTSFNVTVIK